MIRIEAIEALTANPKLIAFARFVIAETGEGAFPDYKAMDLMRIASLVTHVWVLDFRDGVGDGPTFHFSGTHIDANYEKNITGKSFEEIYAGEDFDRVITGCYYQVHLQKKVCYTHRVVHYTDARIDKYKLIESILLPCSGDGEAIDFGIGYAEYSFSKTDIEPRYIVL